MWNMYFEMAKAMRSVTWFGGWWWWCPCGLMGGGWKGRIKEHDSSRKIRILCYHHVELDDNSDPAPDSLRLQWLSVFQFNCVHSCRTSNFNQNLLLPSIWSCYRWEGRVQLMLDAIWKMILLFNISRMDTELKIRCSYRLMCLSNLLAPNLGPTRIRDLHTESSSESILFIRSL